MLIGVPVKPNDSRILFSKKRLNEKCTNSGSLTKTTNEGGFTATCVVYKTLSRFPFTVGVGLTANASIITSFNTFVGIRFEWLSLTILIIGMRRCSRLLVFADKKTIGA